MNYNFPLSKHLSGLKPSDDPPNQSVIKPLGLSDAEFRKFLNAVGCFEKHSQFRLAVYNSGVEPALRKVGGGGGGNDDVVMNK